MQDEFDPEGLRLPIKIDNSSNGEFVPHPLSQAQRKARDHAFAQVTATSKRLGMGRRAFLKSSCGAAATLLALNEAFRHLGASGGLFDIPSAAATEPTLADELLTPDTLIVDMQTHCVDPSGDWMQGRDGALWQRNLTRVFGQAAKCDSGNFDCYSAQQLVKEVFLDSDTDIAVVSALWGRREQNPTPTAYAAEVRNLVETLGDRSRALIHGGVLPNDPGALDAMDEQAELYQVDAWKMYPQWGPNGVGFFMDDPTFGIPTYEKAQKLGIKVICAHRGVPLPGLAYRYSDPADIVRAAKLFPDLTFICYHSGFEPGYAEGPFQQYNDKGVDRLITAFIEQGFAPNQGNVYAELGSTWRYYMSQPDQAAHLMGKLLKHFGSQRICWGTDSLWYGSPQDQIQAFMRFQISEAFQEAYGYPAITPTMRNNILGANAVRIHGIDTSRLQQLERDKVDQLKAQYRQQPNPSFQTFGPKNAQAFNQLTKFRDGLPG